MKLQKRHGARSFPENLFQEASDCFVFMLIADRMTRLNALSPAINQTAQTEVRAFYDEEAVAALDLRQRCQSSRNRIARGEWEAPFFEAARSISIRTAFNPLTQLCAAIDAGVFRRSNATNLNENLEGSKS